MASVKAMADKAGTVYGYRVTVFLGRVDGKTINSPAKTFRIPEELKGKPKQIEKWLNKTVVEYEDAVKNGTVSSENRNFYDYAEYVITLKERDKKHRTTKRYREFNDRIKPEFGFMKMADIRPEHINRFLIKLGEPGANKTSGGVLSASTIVKYHRFIHLVFAQAVREGVVPTNTADRATPPSVKRSEADFYEADELQNIIKCLSAEPLKWQCIVRLMIHTGCRRGEIMGLRWECINFQNNTLTINGNLQHTSEKGTYLDSPKNGERREIPVPRDVLVSLDRLHKEVIQQRFARISAGLEWNDTRYCFVQDNGLPMNPDSVGAWLTKFSKRHGLPHIHAHAFRHSYATLALSNGATVADTAKVLGHKQISTTMNIYTHALNDGASKVANAFEAALKQA